MGVPGRTRSHASRQEGFFGTLDPDKLRWLAVTLLFFTLAFASIMLGWDGATGHARAFAIIAGGMATIVFLGVDRQAPSQRLGQFVQQHWRPGKARANLKGLDSSSKLSRREPGQGALQTLALPEPS